MERGICAERMPVSIFDWVVLVPVGKILSACCLIMETSGAA